MMRVFLGGEGVDELGRFAHAPAYAVESVRGREVSKEPGILEALVERLKKHPVELVGGLTWRRIPKGRRVVGIGPAEVRNVVGLVTDAQGAGCDAVVFVRDRDGDERREADIEDGIRVARERFPDMRIVGGSAVEEIEAWLLAMLGERKSESLKHPKEELRERRGVVNRHDKTRIVQEARFDHLPDDAGSLHRWIDRFRSVSEQTIS